ncbi:hypothetical protein MARINON1_60274 [Marinobacter salarius]|nr:hypothetical protein MBHK15_100220 [Marinobacter salarius]VXC45480.1 hypothetical protein MARINON1_60274 [Marinobacter salarius]
MAGTVVCSVLYAVLPDFLGFKLQSDYQEMAARRENEWATLFICSKSPALRPALYRV